MVFVTSFGTAPRKYLYLQLPESLNEKKPPRKQDGLFLRLF